MDYSFTPDRENAAMDEITSPNALAKPAAPAADEPAPNEEIMRTCTQLLEGYMLRLWGEPAGNEPQTTVPRRSRPESGRRAASPATTHQTCGARLRGGSLCQRPPVEGRRRCRSHGCAPRTGAPKGNRNALKHGCFTAAEIARGRRINEFIRECRATLREVDRTTKGPA